MFKFLILLDAFACGLGAVLPEGMIPQLDGRIFCGDPTTISKFPWQIFLQRNGRHFCGATIISDRCIVTAAHCLQNVKASALRVRAGSSYITSDGTLVTVTAFKNHEGYNAKIMANDIAIIYLNSSLPMSSTIKSITLSTTTPADGTIAAVSGWGRIVSGGSSPTKLRYVDVYIVSQAQCTSSTYGYGNKVNSGMLCAYTVGKDSCQGDSGGPLVSGGALVGVVSWGYGCAFANYPGVYTSVAAYNKWIEETCDSFY